MVGPPLNASAPSLRFVPVGRLLPPASVNPAVLPMALNDTVTEPEHEISGAEPPALPETMLLCTEMVPVPDVRAMPPPPGAPAVLAVTVQFWTASAPVKFASTRPPPAPAAVLLEIVLLRRV